MEQCILDADILDSSTPLRCAQNDNGALRCAQNDNGPLAALRMTMGALRCAQNDTFSL